ncbi:redoxin, partial [Vibrio xuii]
GEEQRVAQFLQSKDYQFENVNDPNNIFMRKWGVQVTPTIFIVNQGKIESITTGVTTPIGIIARVWFSK